MTTLLIYSINVLLSSIMMDVNYFTSIKDLAKDGYTYNKEIYKYAYDDSYPTPIWIRLIPILNLIYSIFITIYRKVTYEEFIGILKENEIIEEINEEDFIQYNEMPSLSSAIKINKKRERFVNSCNLVILFDESRIYYGFDDNNDLVIIRCIGPITGLKTAEREKRLQHVLDLYKAILSLNMSEEEIDKVIKLTKIINFSGINDTITSEESIKKMYIKQNKLSQENNIEQMQNEDYINDMTIDDKPKTLKRSLKSRKKK